MSQKYFGTDGIRGKVGDYPMTPDFVMKLGWAAGVVLAADGTKELLVGKDTRASGYMLESALEASLSAAGVNIALAGPIPTPAVGAAYKVAPSVLAELGANVVNIANTPNGININNECGATSLDSLSKAVTTNKADLGVAVDGDADRIMFVDSDGDVVDGDELLFLMAREAK